MGQVQDVQLGAAAQRGGDGAGESSEGDIELPKTCARCVCACARVCVCVRVGVFVSEGCTCLCVAVRTAKCVPCVLFFACSGMSVMRVSACFVALRSAKRAVRIFFAFRLWVCVRVCPFCGISSSIATISHQLVASPLYPL